MGFEKDITKQVAEKLFSSEMSDAMNDLVNQHRKIIDSEYMQNLLNVHQSALESMKKSGMVSARGNICELG